ncbi:DUF3466 family protein [Ideonella sp.]|uniref:DUF3466 family protein n=1 Tax=Ideonella sp. TaxID=1929293 RepID=UPI0035B13C96
MKLSFPASARLALVAAALATLSQISQALPTYSVRVVTMEGYTQLAEGLNSHGTVAVQVTTQGGANYRCSKAECTPIPSLPNDRQQLYAYPTAIDDQGTVVGNSYVGSVEHAMLWDGAAIHDLGTFGEDECGGCKSFSQAWAINGKGAVVGYSDTANHDYQAFVWRDGTMTKLPTLGGTRSSAHGINDAGDVVGFSSLANGTSHAFLYRDGQIRDLGLLRSGDTSTAYAINNLGQVVGDGNTGQTKPRRVAFLYDSQGGLRELPLLKGWHEMTAHDINDAGWVVGSAIAAGHQSGYVFDGQATFDLNFAISEKDRKQWRIYHATDINAKGQILVEAQNKKDGTTRVLVLTPH